MRGKYISPRMQKTTRMPSFDVTSTVDLQEVDNALNQARKEVVQRYDFKGSKAAIEFNRTESTLTLVADDEFKMQALWEIVQRRMVKRKVPVKNLKLGEIERGAHDTVRRVVTLQQGIPTEAAQRDRQVPEGPQAEEGAGGDPGRSAAHLVAVARRAAVGHRSSCANRISASRCSSATTANSPGPVTGWPPGSPPCRNVES